MPQQPRVLLVDDEDSIRATLPLMLQRFGFSVISTATVPDALRLVSQEKFDVLIADLNVGSPADGFTVVSAMRRTQPQAVTFILTGYPDIDTALEAIRRQVDDYLVKPTDIDALVSAINSKLANRTPPKGLQPQRLPDIIEQHLDRIVQQWLTLAKQDPEIGAIQMPDSDRKDHIPRLLQEAIEHARGRAVAAEDSEAAALHGITRRKQGYTVPLLVREAKLLLRIIAECVQQNLLAIQVSNMLPDLLKVWDIIETELELSMRAYLEASADPSLSSLQSPPERRKARNPRT